jgi:hypothetical protein
MKMSGRIKKGILPCVLLAAVLLSACAKSLPKEEAERLLRVSEYMGKPLTATLTLHRNHVFSADDLRAEHPEFNPLLAAGLVEIRPNKVLFGMPVGARFVLTAEGEREASASWQHASATGGEESWVVVMAQRELVQVAEPVTQGEMAECDFTWKWVATKAGEASQVPTETQTARAQFRLEGEQWVLETGRLN